MKTGWTTRTLGETCDVVNGGTPKTGVPHYWNGQHRWITPAEMGKRITPYVGETERMISEEGLRNSSARMLPPNSVILSSRAPIGHLVINTEPMATNQGCKGLIPGSEVHSKFLYYYLGSIVDLLNSLGTGATFRELSGGKLKEVEIPLPPLAEQHRIVGMLDEAFEGLASAKANAERNLENARALFASHLESVLAKRGPGWDEQPFSELCDIKHGYAFEGEFFSREGEYVLLTPGNFYEHGGYRDRGERQKYYTGEIPHDYVLDAGDLLVAMTEQAAGLLGSPILVPESNKFLHNQRLGLVTKKPGVAWTNEFFFHVFNTQAIREAIHASASGVKVRHTSPTKIGAVTVSFPTSLQEQKRIVAILTSLAGETQRLAQFYEQKLAALEQLKKALLHEAFSGNL